MPTHSSIRLNKYISDSGICSRRHADRHIKQRCMAPTGSGGQPLTPLNTRVVKVGEA